MAAEVTSIKSTSRWDGGQVDDKSGWTVVPASDSAAKDIKNFFAELAEANEIQAEILSTEFSQSLYAQAELRSKNEDLMSRLDSAASYLTKALLKGSRIFDNPSDEMNKFVLTMAQNACAAEQAKSKTTPPLVASVPKPPKIYAEKIQENVHLAPRTSISRILGRSGHPCIGNDDL